ncbi:MAG: AbrB/MazE/SpoVT family DNA-binding domain-containing protein [Desulfurococcaceae archaeon]|nr:AbrB/MazE/SpoVT family DNA-binding domain-containing protein [Desulfurococcaceae archaeon]
MRKFILKVRKKGVVILPKELRIKAGIEENSEVVAEIVDNGVLLRPLKLVTVRFDEKVIDEMLSLEKEVEEKKLRGIFENIRY